MEYQRDRTCVHRPEGNPTPRSRVDNCMGPGPRLSGGALLAGCAGIALAFLGATFLAQRGSEGIEQQALAIANQASPNIQAISNARTELRHLEALVSRALADGGTRLREDQVSGARPDLEGRLEGFKLRGEDGPRLLAQFRKALHQLDLSAERALLIARSAPDPAKLRDAEREVHERADVASAKGAELLQLEVARVEDGATQIELLRRRAGVRELQLYSLCLIAAAGIAALLFASHRRMLALQAAHTAVLQARADELEQFSGRVAHDILGPLGVVGLALDLAEKHRANEPARLSALARGRSSLGRVQRLVDGLLEFARAGATVLPGSATDVPPLVSGLLDELLPEAARARITLEVAEVPPCKVACSPGATISVLANLLRNAIKYIGDGARREVSLRVLATPGHVRFEIEDTGPGIPPGMGDRIFQPWVRGKETLQPGLGLGLATVKKLVEAHGGAVGVQDAATRGALFWVELPRAEDVDTLPGSRPATGCGELR